MSQQEMTATPEHEYQERIDATVDEFRGALAKHGFVDDGETLQGKVQWRFQSKTYTAVVSLIVPEGFPFKPPKVKVIESGSEISPTFHIERNGTLCLWSSNADLADWLDPSKIVAKISGWFEKTAEGWPGDEDTDLERYLEGGPLFVAYDASRLEHQSFIRTSEQNGVVRFGETLAWKPSVERIGRKRIRRREKDLAYVFKAGQVDQPIKNLEDLGVVLSADFSRVMQLVGIGVIKYLAVVYERNGREAVLVVELKGQGYGLPKLIAHESADTSLQTRTLRAGSNAARYKNKKVAIVGNGAIGSYVADLLFRSGVSRLTLIDPEKLRPGNIIRHVANNQYMGWPKSMAVKATLAERGLSVSDIHVSDDRITDAQQAIKLFTEHDLIIDASADLRATSVLQRTASELDRPLVEVWLQRNGDIARVDRFPLWDDEDHLPIIPPGEGEDAYEYGCGSPVSKTPPNAVVRAASLACEVALDQLNLGQKLPATMIEVMESQPDEPYNKVRIITSNDD